MSNLNHELSEARIKLNSARLLHCIVHKEPDVSEEPIRSIFMVDDQTQQETVRSRNQTELSCVVTLCSSEKVQRFGGIYCLYLQGIRVNQARNRPKDLTTWAKMMKKVAVHSSETLDSLGSTRRYNQKTVFSTLLTPRTSNPK